MVKNHFLEKNSNTFLNGVEILKKIKTDLHGIIKEESINLLGGAQDLNGNAVTDLFIKNSTINPTGILKNNGGKYPFFLMDNTY